ncbi:HAD family hydrolase [Actinotalea ferrariae]|uniref:HAD family hydrolase n=1 Tax=Actinotalea ferrariae TaxID=1386098 RepID=UPI0027E03230|nr:HAD family hydrolase [Actinotalea ferrariae]
MPDVRPGGPGTESRLGHTKPDARADLDGRARLVALDLDGTLLTYAGDLRPTVRDAVVAVREAGHHVVLATGRSLHGTRPVAEELGIDDGWLVCSNGSVTVRLDPRAPEGHLVDEVITFDPAPVLRLMAAEFPDAYFAVEEVGTGFRMNKLFPEGELTGDHEVVDLEDLTARHVTRLVVRSPGHTSQEFHDLVARLGLADVTYAIGWTAWMDVAPEGVTKASALERLRRQLGVAPERTVALGDGSNDVDMLRWAARGVAMGHAEIPVQEAADEVTGTVEDDGAVAVLQSLLD